MNVADWKVHLPSVQTVQTCVAPADYCQVETWILQCQMIGKMSRIFDSFSGLTTNYVANFCLC